MDYITEIVQNTFTAPNDSDQIVFNKDFYKSKKETDVGKEMQFALTIPPESRTSEQIKMVYLEKNLKNFFLRSFNEIENKVRAGLQKLRAFAEYPINMQEKICKCAFYQK